MDSKTFISYDIIMKSFYKLVQNGFIDADLYTISIRLQKIATMKSFSPSRENN